MKNIFRINVALLAVLFITSTGSFRSYCSKEAHGGTGLFRKRL